MKGQAAPRAPTRRRPASRPAPRRAAVATPPGLDFLRWRYAPDAAGLALIAASLLAILALLSPEGAVAGPTGRFLTLSFGWLAWLMPAWIAACGVLLISHRVAPRPWPWPRLGGALLSTSALLGLAALEAWRRDGPFSTSPGGGVLGRNIAQALAESLGTPSTVAVLVVLLAGSMLVATAVRPSQVLRGLAWASARVWGSGRQLWAQFRRPRLQINPQTPGPRRVRLREVVPTPKQSSPPALPAPLPPGPDDSTLLASAKRADGTWKTPPVTMFQARKAVEPATGELKEQARIIDETLASFNIDAHVVEANQGPAVTQFGIEPAVGVPVSRITSRLNDFALRLSASTVRIEAPVPGRRMVGIEVPNASISVVMLREVIESPTFDRAKARIPLALGKDIAGKAQVADLARMPHLLIAGATGSGKSVCINSVVACLLSQFTPDELQFLMIDPKMVELVAYNGVPHLRMPVVTDMEKVVGTLKWALKEMERRYKLFAARAVRNIDGYNRSVRERPGERPLPYMVLIIDELADLMMTAPEDVEKSICRLAQLARATGIHLVVATQRPSVDVLTGLIKANFPTRIAFAVSSQVDSRVILDSVGAERLLGRGDMLYLPPEAGKPVRLQGTYVSDQEIDALVAYWKGLGSPQYSDDDLEEVESLGRPAEPADDELYERAVELARETRRISVSLLQRRLAIGYPRAARLVDLLEERGVIGSSQDGRSREVLDDARDSDPD
ncbi:MAG: segregation ATPase FtsK/SpoIIIE, family [Chloroflexota bacterium]|nr:segregation ATPase FtsK/SpoIIIE, family [Chloroflexota bacterium]